MIIQAGDRWHIEGIDFTAPFDSNYLVKFIGGDGWEVTGCEFWGASGHTQLGVGWSQNVWGHPTNWQIYNNYFHDNPGRVAGIGRHNHIYVIGGANHDTNGKIYDNLFVGSPKGTNLKLGSTNLGDGDGTRGVEVMRNTFVNNAPLGDNLLIATRSKDILVENNLFYASSSESPRLVSNVRFGSFAGDDITLRNNSFWGYDTTRKDVRPLLFSNGQALPFTVFDSIDLNEDRPYLSQSGSVLIDPNYQPYNGTSSLGCDQYPPITQGGITYGVYGCPLSGPSGRVETSTPSSSSDPAPPQNPESEPAPKPEQEDKREPVTDASTDSDTTESTETVPDTDSEPESPAEDKSPTSNPPKPKSGPDLNGDSRVNVLDLEILMTSWRQGTTEGDLDNNGTVDIIDLIIMLIKWTD